jgi:predicted transposase YdaD
MFSLSQHITACGSVVMYKQREQEVCPQVHYRSQSNAEDMKSLYIANNRSVEVSHLMDTPVGVTVTSLITIYE